MKKDGDDFDECFKIELKLGAGGTVYKATPRNIDTLPVAVKQIPRHNMQHWDQVSTIKHEIHTIQQVCASIHTIYTH